MGRWRESWAARNPSVRLAWPMPQTRLPLWFRATGSSAPMEVLPDMAAASAGSAGCSFTRGSLWRSLSRDVFQKRHESLNQRRCSANELAETPRRHGDPPMARQTTEKAEAFRAPLKPMSGQAGAMRDPSVAAGAALSLVAATKGG